MLDIRGPTNFLGVRYSDIFVKTARQSRGHFHDFWWIILMFFEQMSAWYFILTFTTILFQKLIDILALEASVLFWNVCQLIVFKVRSQMTSRSREERDETKRDEWEEWKIKR